MFRRARRVCLALPETTETESWGAPQLHWLARGDQDRSEKERQGDPLTGYRALKRYVACAGIGEKPDQWRVFAFAEGGTIALLRGRDRSAEALATLFAAVRRCLESAPDIRALREEVT